jgi:hydroxylamine reductase
VHVKTKKGIRQRLPETAPKRRNAMKKKEITRRNFLECGEKNLRAMELLSIGNTEAYGHPVPTKVPLGVKKGKAILVSGHDLIDLEAVLKASEGKGIYVYTHGEMLPSHGYPKLKERFPHFYGHYGTAWQNQKKEFDAFPGAILMTTNCIQKPKQTYKQNIFTTGTVGWPGVTHVNKNNLKPLIDRAWHCRDTLKTNRTWRFWWDLVTMRFSGWQTRSSQESRTGPSGISFWWAGATG